MRSSGSLPPAAASRVGSVHDHSGPNRWSSVSKFHTISVASQSGLDKVRVRISYATTDEVAEREGIVFEANSANELRAIDKAHQANRSVHSLEAWEKRFALRRNKLVREALHEWWMTLLCTIKPAFNGYGDESALPVLDKANHVRLIVQVCAALNRLEGDEEDEESAIEMALEDWERDSKVDFGSPRTAQGTDEAAGNDRRVMPREAFLDGIFQIADLYTDSVSALEYATFLKNLLRECSFEQGLERIFWKVDPAPLPPPPPVEEGMSFSRKRARESSTKTILEEPIEEESPPPPPPPPPLPPPPPPLTPTEHQRRTSTSTSSAAVAALLEVEPSLEPWPATPPVDMPTAASPPPRRRPPGDLTFKTPAPAPAPSKKVSLPAGAPGERGRLQYWALRKGLPPQLQEGLDQLTEDEWAHLGRLPEAEQHDFVLKLLIPKMPPKEHQGAASHVSAPPLPPLPRSEARKYLPGSCEPRPPRPTSPASYSLPKMASFTTASIRAQSPTALAIRKLPPGIHHSLDTRRSALHSSNYPGDKPQPEAGRALWAHQAVHSGTPGTAAADGSLTHPNPTRTQREARYARRQIQQMRHALITIQAHTRRRKKETLYMRIRRFVRQLQALVRNRRAVQPERRQLAEARQAASTMQRHARGQLGRSRLMLARLMLKAACKLQAAVRSHRARRRAARPSAASFFCFEPSFDQASAAARSSTSSRAKPEAASTGAAQAARGAAAAGRATTSRSSRLTTPWTPPLTPDAEQKKHQRVASPLLDSSGKAVSRLGSSGKMVSRASSSGKLSQPNSVPGTRGGRSHGHGPMNGSALFGGGLGHGRPDGNPNTALVGGSGGSFRAPRVFVRRSASDARLTPLSLAGESAHAVAVAGRDPNGTSSSLSGLRGSCEWECDVEVTSMARRLVISHVRREQGSSLLMGLGNSTSASSLPSWLQMGMLARGEEGTPFITSSWSAAAAPERPSWSSPAQLMERKLMDQRLSAVLAETLEQRVLPADPLAASHMRSSALRKEITGGGDQDVGGKGSPHEVPDTAFRALAEELRRIRSQPHAPTIKHLKHMSSPLPAIDHSSSNHTSHIRRSVEPTLRLRQKSSPYQMVSSYSIIDVAL